MSKTTTAAARPKSAFAAASFANLRAAAGESAGEPLRIAIADIDEDPEQPRRNIDASELEALAESIRLRGVLQPVGVRPPVDGRYVLAFGARRLRASRMAGKTDIAAIIVDDGQRDFATQVIENQHRQDLANSEVAAAVNRLFAEGHSIKAIEAICNLKEWEIAEYRAVEKFPEFLKARLDRDNIRALYELYRQWKHSSADVEAAISTGAPPITVAEARRIVSAVGGKSKPSSVPGDTASTQLMGEIQTTPAPEHGDRSGMDAPIDRDRHADETERALAPEVHPEKARADEHAEPTREAEDEQASAATRRGEVPVFVVVAGDGEEGELVVDRRAPRAGRAFVSYGGNQVEVGVAELRIVGVR